MAQINFLKTTPSSVQPPYEGYVSMFYSDQDTLSFVNSTGSLYPTLSGYIATSSVAFKAIDLLPGNKQLNGNFTITGSNTAQSYTVANQVFNKQVISPSGSTIFGAYIDDNTHQFTGSFSSTGSSQFKGNMIVSGTLTVSGNILQPSRPAFRVTGSSVAANFAETVISGSAASVDYNVGGYYNVGNGQFTAPFTGLYQVYFNARATTEVLTSVSVRKNNIPENPILFWESLGSNGHHGVSTVASLAAGDVVTARVIAGTCSFDRNDNWGVAFIG